MDELLDAIPHGDAPWHSFTMAYNGPLPNNPPEWMTRRYQVFYRDARTVLLNQLANPDFDGHFDSAPYKDYKPNGKRVYQNFFSANWSWKEAVCLRF